MGVDIEWGELPEPVKAAWEIGVYAKDDEVRLQAYVFYVSSGAYYQNAWETFREYEHAMDCMGMLCHPSEPSFPDDPGYEELGAEVWDIREHLLRGLPLPKGITSQQVETVRRHIAEVDKVLARRPHSPARGIPAYKLSSNDAWLVQPDEIEAALAAFDGAHGIEPLFEDQDEQDEWQRWIDYLREAAQHGGFRMG